MASATAIKAGRAYVELFADKSRLTKDLAGAKAAVSAFGAQVQRVGLGITAASAAVLTPLLAAAKTFVSAGDTLAKASGRTGVTVENLSTLQYAADQSGASLETLEGGLRRMASTITDAGAGSKASVDALKRLGVTAAELDRLSPDEQFKRLGDALSAIDDPTTRAALAMDVFGKSGTQLLPMLADGRAGIERLQDAAKRLGLEVSTKDAAAAEVLGDAWDNVKQTTRAATMQIGAALAPALTALADKITSTTTGAVAWVKANRELIVTLAKAAAVGGAIGAVLTTLGTVLKGVSTAIGVVGKMLTLALAHPAVAAVAAVTALVLALERLDRARYKTTTIAQDALRAGNEERAADFAKLDRLKKLAEQEKLTTAEMRQAKQLIEQLTTKYGPLGISIDETTGRLNVQAGAYDRLGDAARDAAAAQIRAALAETDLNIEKKRRHIRSFGLAREAVGAAGLGPTRDALEAEINVLDKDRSALILQLRALASGRVEGLTGGAVAPEIAPPVEPDRAAAVAVADVDADLRRRAHELRLQQIKDEADREIALLGFRYDEEERRIREAAAAKGEEVSTASIQLLLEARDLEAAALLAKAEDERQRSEAERRQTIEELTLQTKHKGADLEREMLSLEEKRAVAAAEAAGMSVASIKEEYRLRRQIAAAAAAAGAAAVKTSTAGTFYAAAVRGLGSQTIEQRIARATEETARNTRTKPKPSTYGV